MTDILIADDHPIVLHGTQAFLQASGYRIIASCENGIEAYNQVLSKRPAIAIMDISMPGMTGLEVIKKLHQTNNQTKFILLTLQNELAVFNYARSLGVKGYLLKEFALQELLTCLELVQGGKEYFSPKLIAALHISGIGDHETQLGVRQESNTELDVLSFAEKKILSLIAEQKSSREISQMLFISEKTVETHRGHIIKKLGIPPQKNALLKWALEKGRNSLR